MTDIERAAQEAGAREIAEHLAVIDGWAQEAERKRLLAEARGERNALWDLLTASGPIRAIEDPR